MVLLFVFPLQHLFFSWQNPDFETLESLTQNLGKKILTNTLLLILGVCTLSTLISFYLALKIIEFPPKIRFVFDLLAISPLAFPSYVYASTFIGLYGPDGTIASLDLSPLSISIMCLSFAFYPYSYLFLRTGLARISQNYIWQATLLGASPLRILFKIKIPLLMPWLIAGLLIISMECLAEFGALSLLSLETFTTLIYKTWFGYFSIEGAAQLASILFIPALGLTLLDKRLRKKLSVESKGFEPYSPKISFKLSQIFIIPLMIFSFVLPLLQLFIWILRSLKLENENQSFVYIIANKTYALIDPILGTLGIGILTASICLIVAILISFTKIYFNSKGISSFQAIANTGYSLPGTIIAVAFYSTWLIIDQYLADISDLIFKNEADLILSSSGFICLMALCFRFLASPINSLDNAFKEKTNTQILCARTLRANAFRTLKHIVIPQNYGPLTMAFLIVFLESIKELPIVLMTRPLDNKFLSVSIFQYTSEGDWLKAALPSLILVCLGMIGVFIIRKGQKQ